jgi:hypothetical protein
MSTLTRTPASVNPNPVPSTNGVPKPPIRALMALFIPDHRGSLNAYEVERLPVEPGAGVVRLYRLTRHGLGITYDIVLTTRGIASCTCADATFRHAAGDPQDPGCKHIRCLRQFGMLPELPAPAYRSTADLARNDPEAYEAMLGGRPDESPYSAEDIDRMAGGLIDIDMS